MLISFEEIEKFLKEYSIIITGAIHIGAHDCEELWFYNKLGLSNNEIIWVEAMENKVIEAINRGIPNVYKAIVSDKDNEEVIFNISNNGQSSSILELNYHKIAHPDIHYIDNFKGKTIKLDTFISNNNLDGKKYNFWNFDIQGAELLALKGAINNINYADAIYLEVNEKELYKNCGFINEIDDFLNQYNFTRVTTNMTDWAWGDALYIKK